MADFKIELGVKARDKISGFVGTITGRTQYITGCMQYVLEAESKDNAKPEVQWVDEDRLIVIDAPKISPEPAGRGGPHPTPPARHLHRQ